MTFSPDAPSPTTRLRELLAGPDVLHMPGCYDALSARIIELTGFPAAAIGGFGVEAAHLGGPDIGLMTMTELVDQGRRITDTVDIPVITDADTGFGGVQNIYRTVRSLQQAGLAGLHIEDQALPKRCPVLPGRRLVSVAEARDRIATAVEARFDPDFVIIARTDADSVDFDDEVERANAYLDAGADVVLPMCLAFNGAPVATLGPDRKMEIVSDMVSAISGPVMYVGDAPEGYTAQDVGDLGVKIVSPSAITLEAAAEAMKAVLDVYREQLSTAGYYGGRTRELKAGRPILDLMRVEHYLELEARYGH
jgi:methylisocitrate lyase